MTLKEQVERRCVYFTGTRNGACEVGVVYDSVIPKTEPGQRRLIPCLNQCDTCYSRTLPTPEQVTAEIASMRQSKPCFPAQTRRDL